MVFLYHRHEEAPDLSRECPVVTTDCRDGSPGDVHPHPESALCDGPQALVDSDLRALATAVRQLAPLSDRRPAAPLGR